MAKNINAIWIKREIGGIDQSYLFNKNSLVRDSYLAIPDPTQTSTKNFYTGIAGYLSYSLDSDSILKQVFTVGSPTLPDADSTSPTICDFAVIKEGTNNAQESDYIEVVKLTCGDVVGISPTAIASDASFSAGDFVVINSDGKWDDVPPAGSYTVVAKYVGTNADGLYIFHLINPIYVSGS